MQHLKDLTASCQRALATWPWPPFSPMLDTSSDSSLIGPIGVCRTKCLPTKMKSINSQDIKTQEGQRTSCTQALSLVLLKILANN